MSDVHEPPPFPALNPIPFTGLTSEVTTYDGAAPSCIVPTGVGLNGYLEGVDAFCIAADGRLTTLESLTSTLSSPPADSVYFTDNGSAKGWLTPGANKLIGDLGSGIVAVTPAEVFTLLGITASAAEINILDGVTATTTEINYLSGATSNIQAQIDAINLETDCAQNGLKFSIVPFVESGIVVTDGGGLNADISTGNAVINGCAVTPGSTTESLVATRDNYIDLNEDGTYTVTDVAISDPAPAIPADHIRIAKVETDGSSVVTITDLKDTEPIDTLQITDEAVSTPKIADDAVTADKLDDTGVVPGTYALSTITIDAQGRITAASAGIIPPASGDLNASDTIPAASTTHAFNHGLGKFPSITVRDATGLERMPEVIHVDNNNVTINISPATSGIWTVEAN